ncbi:MAG: hypothetical protein KYQ20_02460 [Candidatus Nealsonbacteria bacterium]|nr:hypothetical protein [Candidatus Nealsonbacteria bacterium]
MEFKNMREEFSPEAKKAQTTEEQQNKNIENIELGKIKDLDGLTQWRKLEQEKNYKARSVLLERQMTDDPEFYGLSGQGFLLARLKKETTTFDNLEDVQGWITRERRGIKVRRNGLNEYLQTVKKGFSERAATGEATRLDAEESLLDELENKLSAPEKT